MDARAASLFVFALAACGTLGSGGEDAGTPPPNPPPPPPTSACIVDNQYCYDAVSETRCGEIDRQEGQTAYFPDSTCADRAYVMTCPNVPGKFQLCPEGAVSGACVIENRECRDGVTGEECRQIGRTQGDVMYWDAMSCAERGFGAPDAGTTDTGTIAADGG